MSRVATEPKAVCYSCLSPLSIVGPVKKDLFGQPINNHGGHRLFLVNAPVLFSSFPQKPSGESSDGYDEESALLLPALWSPCAVVCREEELSSVRTKTLSPP